MILIALLYNSTVAIRNLWFNETIKEAIDAPRIHHQLFPDHVMYQKNFPHDVVTGLKRRGHKCIEKGDYHGFNVISAIASTATDSINDGHEVLITANSDYRKGGTVDGQ